MLVEFVEVCCAGGSDLTPVFRIDPRSRERQKEERLLNTSAVTRRVMQAKTMPTSAPVTTS